MLQMAKYLSTLIHDQTQPSKLGSTVENMVEPVEMAGNECLGAHKSKK
jgi:hypothetical protein